MQHVPCHTSPSIGNAGYVVPLVPLVLICNHMFAQPARLDTFCCRHLAIHRVRMGPSPMGLFVKCAHLAVWLVRAQVQHVYRVILDCICFLPTVYLLVPHHLSSTISISHNASSANLNANHVWVLLWNVLPAPYQLIIWTWLRGNASIVVPTHTSHQQLLVEKGYVLSAQIHVRPAQHPTPYVIPVSMVNIFICPLA